MSLGSDFKVGLVYHDNSAFDAFENVNVFPREKIFPSTLHCRCLTVSNAPKNPALSEKKYDDTVVSQAVPLSNGLPNESKPLTMMFPVPDSSMYAPVNYLYQKRIPLRCM